MNIAEALISIATTVALRERSPTAYAEIDRICAIPVRRPLTRDECEAVSRYEFRPEAYAAGKRLFPTQAEFCVSLDADGTAFGNIGVGWG